MVHFNIAKIMFFQLEIPKIHILCQDFFRDATSHVPTIVNYQITI